MARSPERIGGYLPLAFRVRRLTQIQCKRVPPLISLLALIGKRSAAGAIEGTQIQESKMSNRDLIERLNLQASMYEGMPKGTGFSLERATCKSLREAAAALEAMEWQPIETAPEYDDE